MRPIGEAYLTTLSRRYKTERIPNFTEIFIQPTAREIRDMKNSGEMVKALLLDNDDVIMWAGHRIHHGDVIAEFDIEQASTANLMLIPGVIIFYGYYKGDQMDFERNQSLADKIAQNVILRRWGALAIRDNHDHEYHDHTTL